MSRLIVAGIGRYDDGRAVASGHAQLPDHGRAGAVGVSAEVRRLAVDTMLSGAAAGTHADYPQRRSRSSCPGDTVTGLFSRPLWAAWDAKSCGTAAVTPR